MPFTVEQFLQVFENYNLSLWPMQVVLNLLGLLAIVLAVKRYPFSDKAIAAILSFLWCWVGIAYHLVFFTAINKAAYLFGVLNVLQGLLFLVFGVFKSELSFRYHMNGYGLMGSLILLYAMVIYPALGSVLGHAYPKAPTFGLPCPTTIFTFGLLLWTDRKVARSILVIPILWAVVGFSAAFAFGMREDIGLIVSGLVATTMILVRDRRVSGVRQTATPSS